MNIVGPPFGKISLVPDSFPEWNINQAIVIYRPFLEYKRKLFLYALLTEVIQKWLQKRGKATAGQYNYTITMSRSLPVPLPPIIEQSIILEEIERHFSQIDHLENTIITSLRQAETLRQSILKQAFEGKLVPQDPNDEPASVLLERIKAEKASRAAEGKKGKTLQRRSPKRTIKNAD
jgi:type I restriction enzyme S subunit